MVKNPPANAGDTASVPGSGRSPEKCHGQRSLAGFHGITVRRDWIHMCSLSIWGECVFSHIWLFVACQASLSMRFSRQEFWSGLAFPPPGDLPDRGIKQASPTPPLLAGRFFYIRATWEALHYPYITLKDDGKMSLWWIEDRVMEASCLSYFWIRSIMFYISMIISNTQEVELVILCAWCCSQQFHIH